MSKLNFQKYNSIILNRRLSEKSIINSGISNNDLFVCIEKIHGSNIQFCINGIDDISIG